MQLPGSFWSLLAEVGWLEGVNLHLHGHQGFIASHLHLVVALLPGTLAGTAGAVTLCSGPLALSGAMQRPSVRGRPS